MTKLEQLIDKIEGKHVYIQTHNFPDPDAISSAYGLQLLLKAKGIDSTICYKGKIDRRNCIAMLEQFSIKVENVDEIENMNKDDEVILVDAQKGNGNTYDIIGTEIASIDHHPTFEKQEYKFSDIRDEVGACASIVASYFFENDISMDRNVSTALMYGLKIDTADMTRGVSKLDLEVFNRLYFNCDLEIISMFSSNELQMKDLKAYAHAIDSIEIHDNLSFAHTGSNCPDALIANISDFIMALDTVDFSVVYSYNKGGIKLSVRSGAHSSFNAGEITMKALKGFGTGGGHFTMAGGFAPYSNDFSVEEQVDIIKNRFEELVYEVNNI